ncbi:hypothetical protein PROFUN_10554 [Planoprotostelium fungivorum]|uniref:Uncharacterized protein n=1 Tax=Planoprotostelium fungivorum TaxID=1890364 RepID=A0A2P6N6S4_9EUKA|nr:hypothetical protein PROFUN_10554 [Planoprotostelium fungivorum]
MVMLKGIPSNLSPELFHALMSKPRPIESSLISSGMGHGDEIVLADGNFPSASCATRLLIRADGDGVTSLLNSIIRFFPIDPYVDDHAVVMDPTPGDKAKFKDGRPDIWTSFDESLKTDECYVKLTPISRDAFYERAKKAFAVVATSERAVYANLILKKGVIYSVVEASYYYYFLPHAWSHGRISFQTKSNMQDAAVTLSPAIESSPMVRENDQLRDHCKRVLLDARGLIFLISTDEAPFTLETLDANFRRVIDSIDHLQSFVNSLGANDYQFLHNSVQTTRTAVADLVAAGENSLANPFDFLTKQKLSNSCVSVAECLRQLIFISESIISHNETPRSMRTPRSGGSSTKNSSSTFTIAAPALLMQQDDSSRDILQSPAIVEDIIPEEEVTQAFNNAKMALMALDRLKECALQYEKKEANEFVSSIRTCTKHATDLLITVRSFRLNEAAFTLREATIGVISSSKILYKTPGDELFQQHLHIAAEKFAAAINGAVHSLRNLKQSVIEANEEQELLEETPTTPPVILSPSNKPMIEQTYGKMTGLPVGNRRSIALRDDSMMEPGSPRIQTVDSSVAKDLLLRGSTSRIQERDKIEKRLSEKRKEIMDKNTNTKGIPMLNMSAVNALSPEFSPPVHTRSSDKDDLKKEKAEKKASKEAEKKASREAEKKAAREAEKNAKEAEKKAKKVAKKEGRKGSMTSKTLPHLKEDDFSPMQKSPSPRDVSVLESVHLDHVTSPGHSTTSSPLNQSTTMNSNAITTDFEAMVRTAATRIYKSLEEEGRGRTSKILIEGEIRDAIREVTEKNNVTDTDEDNNSIDSDAVDNHHHRVIRNHRPFVRLSQAFPKSPREMAKEFSKLSDDIVSNVKDLERTASQFIRIAFESFFDVSIDIKNLVDSGKQLSHEIKKSIDICTEIASVSKCPYGNSCTQSEEQALANSPNRGRLIDYVIAAATTTTDNSSVAVTNFLKGNMAHTSTEFCAIFSQMMSLLSAVLGSLDAPTKVRTTIVLMMGMIQSAIVSKENIMDLVESSRYVISTSGHSKDKDVIDVEVDILKDQEVGEEEDVPFWDEISLETGEPTTHSPRMRRLSVTLEASPLCFKSGTLNKMVEHLTTDETIDESFMKIFLSTYESFTTSTQLLHKLSQRFQGPEKLTNQNSSKRLRTIQHRVSIVLKYWLENRFNDFGEQQLQFTIQFIHQHVIPEYGAWGKALEDLIEKRVQQRYQSYRESFPPPQIFVHDLEGHNMCTFFLALSETEIARQLTIIDQQIFFSVEPAELINQSWNRSRLRYKSPNVLRMINRANKISFWIATIILENENVHDRVKVVTKLIAIAEILKNLNNYNTLMGFVAGLNMSAILRLKKTFEEVSTAEKELFKSLEKLMSPSKSYSAYRTQLKRSSGPILPYIGTYLSDLTFIDEGNPDKTKEGSINYQKLELLHQSIAELTSYQQIPYDFPRVEPLYSFLIDLPACSEKELYKLSLRYEAREERDDGRLTLTHSRLRLFKKATGFLSSGT